MDSDETVYHQIDPINHFKIKMARLLLCVILLMGIKSTVNAVDATWKEIDYKTDSPIIGVLAQEIAWSLDAHWPGVYESYIAASYVKFVEGGGARVVPVW